MVNKKAWALLAAPLVTLALMGNGCATDADVATKNISTASEQFEIARRITVINNITDKIQMIVEGKCSMEYLDKKTEIICKLKDGTILRNDVQRGDNVTLMVEQTTGTAIDTSQYRVIFKPEAVVPNFDRP